MAKKVLILGSGFGAVYTYRALRKAFRTDKEITVTILAKTNYFLFSPMLHEVATGGLDQRDIVQSIRGILNCCQDAFIECEVSGINAETKRVSTNRGEFSYDYLVVAVGANASFFNVLGAAEFALPLKTLHDALAIRSKILSLLEESLSTKDQEERRRLLRWVVVGAGPTGVELAAEMVELAESFAKTAPMGTKFEIDTQLHQSSNQILATFDPKVQKVAASVLRKKGVIINLNSKIIEVKKNGVTLASGEFLPAGVVIWTAGVAAVPLICNPTTILNDRQCIKITQYLNTIEYPEIFAVGDVAYVPGVPQTAQAAVAEAIVAGKNILAMVKDKPLIPFHFKEKGTLVSLGQWRAAGMLYGVKIEGRFAWWLWRTIYLFKLIGVRNRIRVAIDWTLNLFFLRDISQI
ncbi:MAG: NAD(P)/FAD-dependent oxidoreductase [Patescibacteria group bacterium]|jgi:NADH dehydrogenase